MSAPFVAEIRMFPFNFAPKGWAMCAGQLLPISQNTALFSLLGTTYGGDGKSNFALPDLMGNVAIHTDQYSGGGQFPLGSTSGSQNVTLLSTEMPAHTHTVQVDTAVFNTTSTSPSNNLLSNASPSLIYTNTAQNVTMNVQMISIAGGSLPHNNMQPTLTLNCCIALQGVYPARP